MAIAERQAEPPGGIMDSHRRALTIGLILSVSLVAVEVLAVATVMPAAVDEIGGLAWYGWTFSAFMLASLVATVATGERADRIGPAIPFLGGSALFGAGLVVAGLAPSMPVFILGRVLQGGGTGAIATIAYVGIARGYPDALRARMLALLSAAWIVPGLLGPGVAGLLAEHATWRLAFLGLLPLLVVAVLLTLPALRRLGRVETAEATGSSLASALQLAAGAGILLAGLSASQPVLVAGGVALGAALALPALVRLLPPGTLRVRAGLPAGLAVNALLNLGYFTAEAFMPLGLTALRGLTTAQAGVMLTIASVTWAGGAWLQARLDTRMSGRGRAGRVTVGIALAAAGIIVMALAIALDELPIALAAAGWAAGGVGMGLAYPTISLIVLAQARSGQEGNISGSLRVAELFSVAIGTGVGGAVIAMGERLGWAQVTGISIAYGLAFAGTVLATVFSRRLRDQPP